MNLGTGGANVSIDNLISSFKGLQVWNVNSRIDSFIKKQETFDSAIALRIQYGFGDNTQKNQLWDILSGNTLINTSAEGDYTAKTNRDEEKNRVINFTGYKPGMNIDDQLFLGVILGHEAYRDGYETDDNYIETRKAVLAHTEMAIRMNMGGYSSVINDQLMKDIVAYNIGGDIFNYYVDNNYDSSADYWKLLRDGTLVNDNKGWLVDENGDPVLNADGKQIGAEGIETGLLNILFGGTNGVGYNKYSDEQVRLAQSFMIEANMKYDERKEGDMRSRYWTGNKELPLNMDMVMQKAGSTIATQVSSIYYNQNLSKNDSKTWLGSIKENVSAAFNGLVENIEKGLENLRSLLSILKPKSQSAPLENTLASPLEYIIDISNKVFVSDGDSFGFFNSIMNKDIMLEYSARNNGGVTQCGRYVRETIMRELGADVYNSIFEGRYENTNTMFESFKKNENLERIPVTDYNNLRPIQDLADNGVLVLLICKNDTGNGHITFIGNSNMVFDTDFEKAELFNGQKLKNLPDYQLTVVHAGTYPGVTALSYTTNGLRSNEVKREDLLTNNLHFYTVRRR
jgi:hypothetical protein